MRGHVAQTRAQHGIYRVNKRGRHHDLCDFGVPSLLQLMWRFEVKPIQQCCSTVLLTTVSLPQVGIGLACGSHLFVHRSRWPYFPLMALNSYLIETYKITLLWASRVCKRRTAIRISKRIGQLQWCKAATRGCSLCTNIQWFGPSLFGKCSNN